MSESQQKRVRYKQRIVMSPLRLHRWIPQKDVRNLIMQYLNVHDKKILRCAHNRAFKWNVDAATMYYCARNNYANLLAWAIDNAVLWKHRVIDVAWACIICQSMDAFAIVTPHISTSAQMETFIEMSVKCGYLNVVTYFKKDPRCILYNPCLKLIPHTWDRHIITRPRDEHYATCRCCRFTSYLMQFCPLEQREELLEILNK